MSEEKNEVEREKKKKKELVDFLKERFMEMERQPKKRQIIKDKNYQKIRNEASRHLKEICNDFL